MVNGGHLTDNPAGYPGAPLSLQTSRPLCGCVCVKADLWGEDEDLVQTLPCEQVEVGRGPGTSVDESVVPDPHGLVPPRDGARSHHRVRQGGRPRTRPPEGHPFAGVVVEGHDGHTVTSDPAVRNNMRDQCSDRRPVSIPTRGAGQLGSGRRIYLSC